MICAYCKLMRADNPAPCANCGAPSPIQAMPQNANWGTGSQRDVSSSQQQSGYGMMSGSWQHQGQSMPQWSQTPPLAQMSQTPQMQQENSLLPVPYQGGMGLQQMPQNNTMQLIPAPTQDINIAAPEQEEGLVYVPPMYTKPRPIIPRYRIISGLLSFVIVTLMICGGAGYYAKASGKLDLVSRVITGNNPAPPNIAPGGATLPDPSDQVIKGPAYDTIPSATTTSHLINSTIAAQTDRVFKPNQTFYLTYSVYPQKAGKVTIKWYMNNLPYRIVTSNGNLTAGQGVTGMTPMVYASPAEGKVEIDWENQAAQTLFFVVRN